MKEKPPLESGRERSVKRPDSDSVTPSHAKTVTPLADVVSGRVKIAAPGDDFAAEFICGAFAMRAPPLNRRFRRRAPRVVKHGRRQGRFKEFHAARRDIAPNTSSCRGATAEPERLPFDLTGDLLERLLDAWRQCDVETLVDRRKHLIKTG